MATVFQGLSRRDHRNQGNRGDFSVGFSVPSGDSAIVIIPPGIEPTVSVVPASGGTAAVSATNDPIAKVQAETANYHGWAAGDIVNPATEMQSIYGVVTAVKIAATSGAVSVAVSG